MKIFLLRLKFRTESYIVHLYVKHLRCFTAVCGLSYTHLLLWALTVKRSRRSVNC